MCYHQNETSLITRLRRAKLRNACYEGLFLEDVGVGWICVNCSHGKGPLVYAATLGGGLGLGCPRCRQLKR
jgi:hypothetical protein